MRVRHPSEPPPDLAALRADPEVTAEWDQHTRRFRTCFDCRTTYLTAVNATTCERIHEDARARKPIP